MKDAAIIAVLGVAVVMAALTALMIAIMLITRLAPGGKDAKTKSALTEQQDESPEKESVAVIALALALAMQRQNAAPPGHSAPAGAPEPSVSRWASAGREQLMRSRRKAGRTWGRSSR